MCIQCSSKIRRTMHTYIKVFLFLSAVYTANCRSPRNAEELTRCIRIAEPLIHKPSSVFPLSVPEIRNVCSMWDEFVECVDQYTLTFLSAEQQSEFQQIISPSMKSIHQLCSQDPKYEADYLSYAPCMKKIAIETPYCGKYYNYLAQLAESSKETGPAICCGYHKFRTCALQEAKKQCEGKQEGTRDSDHFVSSILNRALGFLVQTCSRIEPTKEECMSYNIEAKHTDKKTDAARNVPQTPITVPNVRRPLPKANPTNYRMDDQITPSREQNSDPPSGFWAPSYLPSRNSASNSQNLPGLPSSASSTTPSTTRFTWTTTTSQSFFPTRNYSQFGDFRVNEIRDPARLYGGSSTILPSICLSMVTLLISTW